MSKPLILVNFKTYEEGTGAKAVELAKKIWKATIQAVDVALAVQPSDIYKIKRSVNIPIYSQHVDSVSFGSNTGSILPEAVKEAGASGTLINHSEKGIPLKDIEEAVNRCKAAGLTTVVCTDTVSEALKIKSFAPDYIAFEVPELIGTGNPISKMQPSNVKEFVAALDNSNVIPLCGAGISSGDDVKAAKTLGTQGVLVASSVVNSKDPTTITKDMVNALK
jgi:triosephosphate isomerase